MFLEIFFFSPHSIKEIYENIHTRADFIASKLSLAKIKEAKTQNYLMLLTIVCLWLGCFLSLQKSVDLEMEAYLLFFSRPEKLISDSPRVLWKKVFVKLHSSFRNYVEL